MGSSEDAASGTTSGATGAGVEAERFRRADRLLDSRDFRRVMRKGRRLSHPDMVLILSRNDGQDGQDGRQSAPRAARESRLGITASRKSGKAVYRNRFKRRVREWFRHRRGEIGEGLDLVVIARRSGVGLSQSELSQRLDELMSQTQARRERSRGGRPR